MSQRHLPTQPAVQQCRCEIFRSW